MIKVEMTGLAKIKAGLKKASQKKQAEIDLELGYIAKEIESLAKQKAPVNFGVLRASIYSEKRGKQWFVGATKEYAIFIEFGTVLKVDIPSDFASEIRSQPYEKRPNTFDKMIESLTLWAKRKGVPEGAVYPIAMTLLKEGMEPKPFLIPAYRKAIKGVRAKINRILNG